MCVSPSYQLIEDTSPPPHTSWDWAESPGRFHVLPPCLLFVLCLLLLSYFSIISSGLPISLLIEKRFPKFTLQNSFLLISAWVFQFYIHFNWQIFRLHFKKKKKALSTHPPLPCILLPSFFSLLLSSILSANWDECSWPTDTKDFLRF